MRNVCYIQARGGSKRFPNKNIALWNGVPVLGKTIVTAIGTGLFDHVCVSSDSEQILSIAQQFGAMPIWRTPENSNDTAIDTDVAMEVMEYFKNYDYACKLYPCAPLLTGEEIILSYGKLLACKCEAVKSVDEDRNDAGAIYWFDVERFKRVGWVLDSLRWDEYVLPVCQDINTVEDFEEARRKAGYDI